MGHLVPDWVIIELERGDQPVNRTPDSRCLNISLASRLCSQGDENNQPITISLPFHGTEQNIGEKGITLLIERPC
jgi:hypothetical protein